MRYRSVPDLERAVLAGLDRLPEADAVAAVPRSGLLPASLIAQARGLPLTDIAGLQDRHVIWSPGDGTAELPGRPLRVLVVDDSLLTGTAMTEVRAQVGAVDGIVPTYVVVYAPATATLADVVLETVPPTRVFAWNVLHHGVTERFWFDLDDVLMPPGALDQPLDLAATSASLRPSTKVGWIISVAAEADRGRIEQWLGSQAIEYGSLVLLDESDHEQAMRRKARHYRRSPASLYVTWNSATAQQLADRSGKAVLAIGGRRLSRPNGVRGFAGRIANAAWWIRHDRQFRRRIALLRGRL